MPEPGREVKTGLQIGDFRIEGKLGAGGMGIVYKARQISLNRVVALKILGDSLTRPNSIARFKREAQAAAKLNHPGVASVYCVAQDTFCYMAMEFIDGSALRELIDRLARTQDSTMSLDSLLHTPTSELDSIEMRFDDAIHEVLDSGDPTETTTDLVTPEARRLAASTDHIRRSCAIAIEAAEAVAYAHGESVSAGRYRYKLDTREIDAARPQSGFVVAVGCFGVGSAWLFYGLVMIALVLPSWEELSSEQRSYFGSYLVLPAVLVPTAWGLFSGRTGATWAGFLVGVLCLVYPVWFGGRDPLAVQFVGIVGFGITIFVVLLRRRTRQWFLLARRLRRKFKERKLD